MQQVSGPTVEIAARQGMASASPVTWISLEDARVRLVGRQTAPARMEVAVRSPNTQSSLALPNTFWEPDIALAQARAAVCFSACSASLSVRNCMYSCIPPPVFAETAKWRIPGRTA
jgi:hypothetical protein